MTTFPDFLPREYLQKAEELQLDPAKITENFIRGSGHGGQKINKTSSCVQLYYEPLKIDIKCQKHREREKNRISAYKLLIQKVEFLVKGEQSAQMQKIFKLRKQKQKRSKRAKEKMLAEKKARGEIKEGRKKVEV